MHADVRWPPERDFYNLTFWSRSCVTNGVAIFEVDTSRLSLYKSANPRLGSPELYDRRPAAT